MKKTVILFLVSLLICISCSQKTDKSSALDETAQDSVSVEKEEAKPKKIAPEDIEIEKKLLYDQYTLEDTYPYKDTTRSFQWDKIKERLALLESIQSVPVRWGILQNYKNMNGEAPLIKTWRRNEYKRVSDTLVVERYQSVPLFSPNDSVTAERYGRDGSLVKLTNDTTAKFIKISTVNFKGDWLVPRKYVKAIADTVVFKKAVFVDVTNQNIATLEKVDSKWLVRSMNPATTGRHHPPHQQETPLGMFVVQEKKVKMFFLVDGTSKIGGFAPNASRFTNGGYLHGVPVNEPRKSLIEYSASLGTTPRSHMCVRNATSHAKFIYDWAPVKETIVFVYN